MLLTKLPIGIHL